MTTPGQIVLGEHPGDDASIVFGDVPTDPPDGRRYLRNVTVATLTPYLPPPDAATGTGVIVAPGGGLHFLSIDNFAVVILDLSPPEGSKSKITKGHERRPVRPGTAEGEWPSWLSQSLPPHRKIS
jgi:hypothetical protein